MGLLQQSQTQVSGQMEIADVLAQWANTEKEPEEPTPAEEAEQPEENIIPDEIWKLLHKFESNEEAEAEDEPEATEEIPEEADAIKEAAEESVEEAIEEDTAEVSSEEVVEGSPEEAVEEEAPDVSRETFAFDDDVLAGIAAALEGKADTAAEMLSEDAADTSGTEADAEQQQTPEKPETEILTAEETDSTVAESLEKPEEPVREETQTAEPEDPKGTFTFDEDVLAGIAAALEGKADTAAEQATSEGIAPEEEEPAEESVVSEEKLMEKPAEEPAVPEEKTEEKPKDMPRGKPARPFSATQTLGGLSMEEKFDLDAQSRVGLKAGLTEEQKKAFSYFVPVRGMSEQIVAALAEAEKTPDDGLSDIGNILVAGPRGCGKTMLALNLIKQIRKLQNQSKGKAAIIHAESLNKKDVPTTIRKVHGGAIIIEDAGDLDRHTVHALDMAMSTDTNNMIVVLEDSKKKLSELLRRHEVFARKFNIRMQIPDFINDELVTFGQAYAQEHGYKIDDMGILALYSRIDVMQKEDHSVTVAEVKDIMDAAFVRSKKNSMRKTMTNFFKSKDENELTTLEEADFAR